MSATPHWICHRCATGNLVHLHERCRLCGHRRDSCTICAGPDGSYVSPYSRQEREQKKEEQRIEGCSSIQGASTGRPNENTNSTLDSTPSSAMSRSRYQPAAIQSPAHILDEVHTSDQAQDHPVYTRRNAVNLEEINAAAWVTNNNNQPHLVEDNSADASGRGQRDRRDGRDQAKSDLGAWSRAWRG